ncbi:hypothetical protein J3R30DRAFT_3709861 [Lentinula aciculospora]|uniref:RWD domain-containing protein n=1 Tax=Lentinula aciculospora TaxID=153920 RepID=A0A9W9A2G3_9AGAR|nr:hypothetical protein J3R30DRAFT_3709861 [Lentinula aciculospora]
MELNEEAQNLEIQALKSIYPDCFFDNVSPKAWKGAAKLPEFNIRVKKDEDSDIFILLNVKYPKAYPTKAIPILSVTQSKGLTSAQVNRILGAIHAEAQRLLGSEAIFSVIEVKEPSGLSLALEKEKRALEEERVLRELAEIRAREEEEKESQLQEQLLQQLQRDALRKEEMHREERECQKARRRALSDATEKPMVETAVETFDSEIEAYDMRFDTVRLYHGRKECLGMTYDAEPVCDEADASVTLELHVVTLESSYYRTQQGWSTLCYTSFA